MQIGQGDNMISQRILASLVLLMCSIGRPIVAFPSIHQQSPPSHFGPPQTTTSNTSNLRSQLPSNAPIWKNHHHHHHRLHGYRTGIQNSIRAGAVTDASTGILGWYARWVDEKPLLAKSMTAGIVTTMANVFSQMIVLSSPSPQLISGRRVMMHLLTGVCFIGPYLHVWYGYLDRILAMPQQTHATRTVTKVIVDQSIGLCIFFPLYFMVLEVAESILLGRVPLLQTALAKCRTDIVTIAMMNWRIWPLTNIINFGLVPYQFRVLVNQIVSFFWFAYLSTRV